MDREEFEQLAHVKAVEAASSALYIGTALFNALANQESIDQRQLAFDVVSHLRKLTDDCRDKRPYAALVMDMLANGIVSGMANAVGNFDDDA